jgi:DNA-directed RNA polymerase beta' subunit
MNAIGGQDEVQREVRDDVQNDLPNEVRRVELHDMRAQARRRMSQARAVTAGWVKANLGLRRVGARRGVALSLLLFCLAVVPASAQVVVDSSSKGGGRVTTGGNITFLHTAGAGNGHRSLGHLRCADSYFPLRA